MPTQMVKLQNENNELVSDEINDIISYRPHWVIRKGNFIFLIIVLFLITLTWFIEYPDVIYASARIVALNPPKLITAKIEGKILKIFVKNEEKVIKGAHLGYLESTGNYLQILNLQNWITRSLEATRNNDYEFILNHSFSNLDELGELQVNYQEFQNQLALTKQTLTSGYFQKLKTSLQKDLQYLNSLKNNAYQQKELQKQDQKLQQKEYDAYEALAEDKIIAPLELNQYKSKMITKVQTLEQLNAQIANSNINTLNKQKELLDLEKHINDQRQNFYSSLLELKSQVEKWIQQYVLIAPENGRVMFVSNLHENEFINTGQELFYVQPDQTFFSAELKAGQQGFGKAKTGQKVLIKVSGYPSNEFGYLNGTIGYISRIPTISDSFLIKANLPNGLRTNYNKTLVFKNNLVAIAEIITDDKKLIEKLTGEFKKLIER